MRRSLAIPPISSLTFSLKDITLPSNTISVSPEVRTLVDSLPRRSSFGIRTSQRTCRSSARSDGSWVSFKDPFETSKLFWKEVYLALFRHDNRLHSDHKTQLGKGRNKIQLKRHRPQGKCGQLLRNLADSLLKGPMLLACADQRLSPLLLEADWPLRRSQLLQGQRGK